jgi:hypothetical protein
MELLAAVDKMSTLHGHIFRVARTELIAPQQLPESNCLQAIASRQLIEVEVTGSRCRLARAGQGPGVVGCRVFCSYLFASRAP